MRKKILVVDDDTVIRDILHYNLEKNDYEVIVASNGEEAIALAREERPHLIVLDIMLPLLDGFEVCRIIRKESELPIIMLTAKSDEVDRVLALRLGADDYMIKPFSIKELLTRIHAQLRRAQWYKQKASTSEFYCPTRIRSGNLEIDLTKYELMNNGVVVKLRRKEFQLLSFLLKNQGIVFDREQLLEKVWGDSYDGNARTIDIHIRSLRKKIEPDPARPRYLITVHGYGYKYNGH